MIDTDTDTDTDMPTPTPTSTPPSAPTKNTTKHRAHRAPSTEHVSTERRPTYTDSTDSADSTDCTNNADSSSTARLADSDSSSPEQLRAFALCRVVLHRDVVRRHGVDTTHCRQPFPTAHKEEAHGTGAALPIRLVDSIGRFDW